ncbi:MAG: type II secretion system protein GspG [Acidobacteria bacterium]|nr:MAG: type II secretion system protein GspG [Acidobacteriota bacterium]
MNRIEKKIRSEERYSRGFTLVEMMAVVVIIGLLAAIIAPKFFTQVDKAKVTRAKTDIKKLEQAIQLYRMETGQFPEKTRDLVKEPDEVRGWNGPYLEKELKDPWQNKYELTVPGNDGRPYEIICLGSDGKEGGEGAARDIKSWSEEGDEE